MRARSPRLTLRTRLVLGNLLLVATALVVAGAVITVTGPPLFRDRLQAGTPLPAVTLDRAERAFHVANVLENLLATAIAFVLTLGVSVLITRPIRRTITAIDATARRFDAGDYAARLPEHSPVHELATLASIVNSMAETIQHTETTRRRMLTDLAHEMRTPLATVDGFLEAIQDGLETADAPTLAVLRGQIRKLTRLAEDVKAISAADENRLRLAIRPTSVNHVIGDAVEALRPAYGVKGVTLTLNPAPPITAHADPHRLGQVITNLLHNALRHTPPGGHVTIAMDTSRGTTQITVRDTGEGIAAEHLPHLFERFYRAHPPIDASDQGSGIGLTISRAIITAHAGTLQVESCGPHHGTTVRITLPAAPTPRNDDTTATGPPNGHQAVGSRDPTTTQPRWSAGGRRRVLRVLEAAPRPRGLGPVIGEWGRAPRAAPRHPCPRRA